MMSLISFTRLLVTPRISPAVMVSIRGLISKHLIYSEFGDPVKVVKYRESEVPELGELEVLVRMLAAPVNPADINTIQGKYPVKVELPCVPGNEGVGIVEDVGKAVQDISKGNKVIVTKPVQGTWRDVATYNQEVLKVVPDELGVVEAATLTVNPCTAYRMLTDYVPVIEKGLVVIQNGANSACGQNVIQICKAWGVKTINIVRGRPDIDELKKYLTELGATYVLTEEELRSTKIFKDKEIDKPSLALNCIGGKSSSEMLRHLQHSGKMVTYGGMSREPVIIPTSAFIFKNASFHGFWMTRWNEKASQSDKDKMMSEIIALMCEKKLKGPVHKMVKFEKYEEALGNALTVKGFTGCVTNNLPCLPSIPGNDGVGDVLEIGKIVSKVKKGDRVLIGKAGLGTWRYHGIFNERDVFPISPRIPLPDAAVITSTTASTAYKLVTDFAPLAFGDTVIQNAADSLVGQHVIQICYAFGIKTLNIVTTDFQYEIVKRHLKCLGATNVLTPEEAESFLTFSPTANRPRLGLNCLEGRHEDFILNMLEKYGVIMYYGDASNSNLEKKCIRPDLTFLKFNFTDWYEKASCIEKMQLTARLIQLVVVGKLKSPMYEPIEPKHYLTALRNTKTCEAYNTVKYLFDFSIR